MPLHSPIVPTTPTGKTASASSAGAGLGFLFALFLPKIGDILLTATEAAGLTGAISAIAGWAWHQYERRHPVSRVDHEPDDV